MLTPEYLQGVPDPLVELYAQAEADILADMARRINGFDMFIPSAQYQMQKLEEMGVLRSEIISKLGKLTGKSERELAEIMRAAGLEALSSDEKIYKIAGVATAEHGKLSPAALKVLQAGFEKTNGLFTNLTKTTANTATKQFERALDRAYMQVSSGAFTSGEAVKSAVKSLAEQGIEAITYPSGHKDTIETAVRRAVITGVNQTCLKMQEARADELGCDLVETTAHPGARPTHAEWQGQIFSRSGKSRKYPDFVQVTGYGTGEGLGGWNCSHSFSPYFEGMPRTYTPEMLESYQAKDYEYNGEKMTLYEAQQKQREIERNLRRWKRENLAMKAAGQDTTQSAKKISEWQARQKDFLSQTGLKRQPGREQIAGWDRSEAASAVAQANRPETKALHDFKIGRSAGAKAKNYEVIDRESGIVYHFLEGSKIQNAEIFAGAGVRKPLRPEVAEGLAEQFGGKPSDWQHAKGFAELSADELESRLAEVHWFQAKNIGKVKFFVKRWMDE